MGWVLLVTYSAGIFWISSRPVPERVTGWIPGFDKVIHAGVYAGWAGICLAALAGSWPRLTTRARTWTAFLLAVGYGASDEFHQLFVPGRTADLLDLAADAAGAAVVVLAWRAWRAWRRPRSARGRAARSGAGQGSGD